MTPQGRAGGGTPGHAEGCELGEGLRCRSTGGQLGTARGGPQRLHTLTGLGSGVLGAALEGEAEQQLVAAAARAHQDDADGAGALAHAGTARHGQARRKAARLGWFPLPRPPLLSPALGALAGAELPRCGAG